jgi:hypothetical protein
MPDDGWDRDERQAIEELGEELETVQARHQHDPDISLLRAARHQALPSELLASVEHRLSTDPWTRALVDGLDEAEPTLTSDDEGRLLARLHRDIGQSGRHGRSWAWLRPALAAAALTAVAVTFWMMFRGGSQIPHVPARSPDESAVAGPTEPTRFLLPLDKPEVMISLSALTWRGEGSGNQLLADLKRPLDAFREGDYARADREFTALEPRYPNAVEVFFYGGVSRLFLDEPQRADASLARAGELADATFAPHIAWYRAIAEQRVGNLAGARVRLEELCRGTGNRSGRACNAVREIDETSGKRDSR